MKIKISWRIWMLIIFLILAIIIIAPSFEKGVVIKSVDKNSTAYEQGLRPNMIITAVNGIPVNNFQDYSNVTSSIFPAKNKTKITITTKDSEFVLFTGNSPNLTVSDIPQSRIKTGLDLSGGARALVKAQNKTLTASEVGDLVSITSNRLNEFGIADVTVTPVTDLSGNNFMQVEVAGATPADLNDLISQQGKFEAKIGNETLFIGGKQDITYVARSGDQSGIYSCNPYQGGYVCNFRFAITLSPEAAQRHAEITSKIGINTTNPEYLDKQLDLYLDDQLVESLFIGKDLKGSETTQIAISGSGTGKDQKEAYTDASAKMKKLQTVLITGSLPYKLEIVKIDSISPVLGKEFTTNIIYLGVIVFIGVALVVFIRYRKLKITLAMMLTMFSEALITLGVAALIHWNLDAPSIAGIIAGIGTGVDDQIVIIDEALSSGSDTRSLKEKIKSAFFIIFAAFFLTVAAMIPLFWAGAGLLKGFALTTIIGVSIGVLVTRPAFSDIVKLIVKD
jgi:preprotein translocase subunit SecD